MTIVDHNLQKERVLKIESFGTELSVSAFIGFCVFLVSRGSMAVLATK